MERFAEFIHLAVALDVLVAGVAFALGVVIAPIAILVHGTCWWRRRLKWAAVAAFTSWIGLWLFLRNEAHRSGTGGVRNRST